MSVSVSFRQRVVLVAVTAALLSSVVQAADALPSASATGAVVVPGVVTPPPVGLAPGTRVRGSAAAATLPQDNASAPAMAFEAERGRISYAVGMEMARNFRKNEVQVDVDELLKGLQDGIAGKRPVMGEKEMKKLLNYFTNVMRARTMTSNHELAKENRRKSELFLAENRKQPDVRVLPNGVQFKELRPGSGPRPTDIDIVEVNWRGTTLDGTEFDGSETGKPMSVPVAELFNGFHSIITQMPVGAHWQVWIPPAMAYGERGVGTEIGPNATLVLDLDLLGIRNRNASGR